MKDIVLNGVSIAELKKQRELVKKDAAKVVSDAIEAATKALDKLLADDITADQVPDLAKEAYDNLEVAELVSGVSGVQFYLPYNSEYGDPTYSSQIENVEYASNGDYAEGVKEAFAAEGVSALYRLLESMESDSYGWHNSNCY